MYIIIVGAGRIGRVIADWAQKMKDDMVVIEKDKEKCKEFSKKYDAVVINADATVKEILESAEIDKADALVATADDNTNLIVTEAARRLNSKINLVSIVNNKEKLTLYKNEKRNVITVNKNEIIGDRLYGATIGLGPGFIGFRKVKYGDSSSEQDFIMFQTPPLPQECKFVGKTIGEAGKLCGKGGSIRVVERKEGKIITNPNSSTCPYIEAGDILTIITPIDKVSDILKDLGFSENRVTRIFGAIKEIISKRL